MWKTMIEKKGNTVRRTNDRHRVTKPLRIRGKRRRIRVIRLLRMDVPSKAKPKAAPVTKKGIKQKGHARHTKLSCMLSCRKGCVQCAGVQAAHSVNCRSVSYVHTILQILYNIKQNLAKTVIFVDSDRYFQTMRYVNTPG